ncbi:uncharacterized protein LOC129919907 [Episyrphus balteatus]|uniref:uncharacterized protein LOC129919907 n=1 Tax=Episyrphus balteatus TaxID=286459 RepID=UPI0024850728|nr:uncharacterized protein LOC129919907 [Episyrphus balteatus]
MNKLMILTVLFVGAVLIVDVVNSQLPPPTDQRSPTKQLVGNHAGFSSLAGSQNAGFRALNHANAKEEKDEEEGSEISKIAKKMKKGIKDRRRGNKKDDEGKDKEESS